MWEWWCRARMSKETRARLVVHGKNFVRKTSTTFGRKAPVYQFGLVQFSTCKMPLSLSSFLKVPKKVQVKAAARARLQIRHYFLLSELEISINFYWLRLWLRLWRLPRFDLGKKKNRTVLTIFYSVLFLPFEVTKFIIVSNIESLSLPLSLQTTDPNCET